MAYTLGEAAKATGRSKTSIRRALDSGRISGTKNEAGEWHIDPAELHRVYAAVSDRNRDGEQEVAQSVPPGGTPVIEAILTARAEAAEREAALLREVLNREREQFQTTIDDLRTDRDHWRQQATALLTDQRPKEGRRMRPWLSRLFGYPAT